MLEQQFLDLDHARSTAATTDAATGAALAPRAWMARTHGGASAVTGSASTIAVGRWPVERAAVPRSARRGSVGDTSFRSAHDRRAVAWAQILPVDRAPQLWIPDSALWVAQLQRWKPTPVASFASSPVVMASSRDVIEKLGWDEQAPTWDVAMTGQQTVAAVRHA